MTWYRRPQGKPVETEHFLEPGDVCEVCREPADVVVVHREMVQRYYCEYCIIIIVSEWGCDDED